MGLPQEKKVTGVDMVKAMARYIWPEDNPQIKKTVLTSLIILVSAKVLNTGVPFIFRCLHGYHLSHSK